MYPKSSFNLVIHGREEMTVSCIITYYIAGSTSTQGLNMATSQRTVHNRWERGTRAHARPLLDGCAHVLM
jgi:hypothetical protein